MTPVRTFAEVWPLMESGDVNDVLSVTDDEASAAWSWLFFEAMLRDDGRQAPEALPPLPGVSDLGRWTWDALCEAADGVVIAGSVFDALAEHVGWRDGEGAPNRALARVWFDEPVRELVFRGVVRAIDGGALLQRMPEAA